MDRKLRVMLTTEGTYPFHQGGVSTWSNTLVNRIDDVEYVVYSVIMNPFVTQKFDLPDKTELIKLPLWGTEEPGEHLKMPFSKVFEAKNRTTDKIVKTKFLPLFRELISGIIIEDSDYDRLGDVLVELYEYFKVYEYKVSFKSQVTWEAYKQMITEFSYDHEVNIGMPNVFSMIQSLGWIYRFMNTLNTPVPKVDVAHSSAAAFCGIPCILAKKVHGSGFLLTEHGVYVREQYLSLVQRDYPTFLSDFLVKLVRFITRINYHFADQVSPVCSYNTRWEKEMGVSERQLNVIYNGVDASVFRPKENYEKRKEITVVSLARIDPIKDIKTLIETAKIVSQTHQNIKFVVYGSVSVEAYYEQCKSLISEYNLEKTFVFAGHTNDVVSAYQSGDIVALSSISEAFPYSVIEAMMCERPVIATDVGGVSEAIGDAGMLVDPRNPKAFASAVIKLADNPELRSDLGQEGRNRAVNLFSIRNMLDNHMKSYILLAIQPSKVAAPIDIDKKMLQLSLEIAESLFNATLYEQAIEKYSEIVSKEPLHLMTPYIFWKISEAHELLGNSEASELAKEKAVAFELLQEGRLA